MECVRMRGVCVLALVTVLALLTTSPVSAQSTRRPDGQPRPPGYPEIPTKAYGATPDCVDPATNTKVDCEWYGFAHEDWPATGALCLTRTRAYMSNTTLIGLIAPYSYYYLRSQVFDTTTNASYCVYGCFKLDAASAPGSAPPPVNSGLPPPEVSPPPTVVAPPPPVVTPPPPPVLRDPPVAPSPVTVEPPPSSPPVSDPATPPPPAAPRGVVNLNAAGLVRPVTGVLSLVVSGALLVLHLLVC